MKHIRTFEELNFDTYYNAGKKLKDEAKVPGGKSWERDKTNTHYKRGAEIHKWAYTKEYKDLGILDVYSNKGGGKAEAMISSLHIDPLSFFESFIAEDDRPETGYITMFTQVYNMSSDDVEDLYFINLPLRWTNDKFHVDGEPNIDTDMITLKDRQSAMKLRKALSLGNWISELSSDPKLDNYDEDLDIKHQFMLYSTPDEYEKMINAFKNISVNKLYK
jgi:hypothetical protein